MATSAVAATNRIVLMFGPPTVWTAQTVPEFRAWYSNDRGGSIIKCSRSIIQLTLGNACTPKVSTSNLRAALPAHMASGANRGGLTGARVIAISSRNALPTSRSMRSKYVSVCKDKRLSARRPELSALVKTAVRNARHARTRQPAHTMIQGRRFVSHKSDHGHTHPPPLERPAVTGASRPPRGRPQDICEEIDHGSARADVSADLRSLD